MAIAVAVGDNGGGNGDDAGGVGMRTPRNDYSLVLRQAYATGTRNTRARLRPDRCESAVCCRRQQIFPSPSASVSSGPSSRPISPYALAPPIFSISSAAEDRTGSTCHSRDRKKCNRVLRFLLVVLAAINRDDALLPQSRSRRLVTLAPSR